MRIAHKKNGGFLGLLRKYFCDFLRNFALYGKPSIMNSARGIPMELRVPMT